MEGWVQAPPRRSKAVDVFLVTDSQVMGCRVRVLVKCLFVVLDPIHVVDGSNADVLFTQVVKQRCFSILAMRDYSENIHYFVYAILCNKEFICPTLVITRM